MRLILITAIVGIILSLYALSLHYSEDGSKICNLGENFNCDKVNKSPWAEFLGIPVAMLGVLSYLIVFVAVLKQKTIEKLLSFTKKDFLQYFFFFTLVMLAFQMYLTSIEIFVIKAYCIICLISQLCTLALSYLTGKELFHI